MPYDNLTMHLNINEKYIVSDSISGVKFSNYQILIPNLSDTAKIEIIITPVILNIDSIDVADYLNMNLNNRVNFPDKITINEENEYAHENVYSTYAKFGIKGKTGHFACLYQFYNNYKIEFDFSNFKDDKLIDQIINSVKY